MTTSNALLTTAAPAINSAKIRKHVPTVARFLLGSMFFVFGLNGFLNFIPPPAGPMPEGAMAFGMALMKTGYMFPLIKGTEVLGGALLLANRFVPVALAILAPVIVNIVAFHAFLTPGDSSMALVILAVELYLAWAYRSAYLPMLQPRTTPGAK
jgi:uncharacterized membrane protein YphA (DoxX/SURF4 family)